MKWLGVTNRAGSVPVADIPVFGYDGFYGSLCAMLDSRERHLANYAALPYGKGLLAVALVADDMTGEILIGAHKCVPGAVLASVSAQCLEAHPFEREMAELHGIIFEGHPWPKPLRYQATRVDQSATQDNYPFYSIEGDALHEVNVGPIHAGIIEPGAFRFVCNGEKVLHLEIALGYQHRGVEDLMCRSGAVKRVCLAESVAGDSAVAHATAYAELVERLAGFEAPVALDAQRAIGLELERMAMHLADVGALCGDVAYQLGQVACEALRTIIINTSQRICGNRFGKGMVRPGGSWCSIDGALAAEILANVADVDRRFAEVAADLKSAPSVLSRFEECGRLTLWQAQGIGAVGMAARASGLARDVRHSHPRGVWADHLRHDPVLHEQGDVMSRLTQRIREVAQSASYIGRLLALCAEVPAPDYKTGLKASSLSFSLVEGWRGEVCHMALTDSKGALAGYKIKDPSVHNWLALALCVRGGGISDFPVCNKSFNLSYCGHDL